jgi:F0F1-type ATP synthase gamma subunit
MDRANCNIDEMLDSPGNDLHRLRHARIDEELSDASSEFKALRDEVAT